MVCGVGSAKTPGKVVRYDSETAPVWYTIWYTNLVHQFV